MKRWLLAAILFSAGILHFISPAKFERILPPWAPWRRAAVYISGAAELLLGIAFAVRQWSSYAGKPAAAFFVLVFPANIYMAVKKIPLRPNGRAYPLLYWLRLPLQLPLIQWALECSRNSANAR
ncbi:hypothetical protein CHL76_07665 [Marinococcus halophilus]|uniref:Membrane protein n=1 Tax=Marinococcus halophilus TaxID=1371 RepID=A0A510Y5P2_MARHA|nr:hypothetical protein [Marinococcus halophilus]OZT80396.1 hypothetical protein CHL76_07665 [Marinococcus halophilus]GEK58463.1 membrane protein [Marinococcus halophilus]